MADSEDREEQALNEIRGRLFEFEIGWQPASGYRLSTLQLSEDTHDLTFSVDGVPKTLEGVHYLERGPAGEPAATIAELAARLPEGGSE